MSCTLSYHPATSALWFPLSILCRPYYPKKHDIVTSCWPSTTPWTMVYPPPPFTSYEPFSFFIPPWSWSVYTEHAVLPRCPPPLHYPALYRVIILTYSVAHTVKETPLHNTIRFLTLGKCDTMAGFRTQHNITQVPPPPPPPPLHYPALYLVTILTYSVCHTVKETPLHNTIRFLTLGKCDIMTGLNTDHSKQFHFTMFYRLISITCTNLAGHGNGYSLVLVTLDMRVYAFVTFFAKIPRTVNISSSDCKTFSTMIPRELTTYCTILRT